MNLHLSSKIPQNSYSRKIFHKNRSNLEIIIKINYKYDQRKKKKFTNISNLVNLDKSSSNYSKNRGESTRASRLFEKESRSLRGRRSRFSVTNGGFIPVHQLAMKGTLCVEA